MNFHKLHTPLSPAPRSRIRTWAAAKSPLHVSFWSLPPHKRKCCSDYNVIGSFCLSLNFIYMVRTGYLDFFHSLSSGRFIHIALCVAVAIEYSIIWLDHNLSFLLLVGLWFVSSLGLLWIMLWGTLLYVSFDELMCALLPSKCCKKNHFPLLF